MTRCFRNAAVPHAPMDGPIGTGVMNCFQPSGNLVRPVAEPLAIGMCEQNARNQVWIEGVDPVAQNVQDGSRDAPWTISSSAC